MSAIAGLSSQVSAYAAYGLYSSQSGACPPGTECSDGTKSPDSASAVKTTGSQKAGTGKELTPEEKRQVEKLRQIDARVRQHEQAHLAAGAGIVTGGPSFGYTYGPDGKQYAVSGEVRIDTSPSDDPQANISKGQTMQAAALAPADPSPQDYRVATAGAQLERRGYQELSQQSSQAPTADSSGTSPAQRGESYKGRVVNTFA